MNSNRRLLPVRIRGGFSDRHGINEENKLMQFKDLDERTRIGIINEVRAAYEVLYEMDSVEVRQMFYTKILRNVYVVEASGFYKESYIFNLINNTIRDDSYDSVFSLLEYLVKLFSTKTTGVQEVFNDFLKREYVGYRFINNMLVPITDDIEINEVNEAVGIEFECVSQHLEKSLSLLSDRENPDYENSIKESISAVEALCSKVLGKGVTLGSALKMLEKNGLSIHPSLKSAFTKLYGYTSDASGIRHAGDIGGESSTFEEAKFMLVSCSAFVNYLIAVCSEYIK